MQLGLGDPTLTAESMNARGLGSVCASLLSRGFLGAGSLGGPKLAFHAVRSQGLFISPLARQVQARREASDGRPGGHI